MQFKLGSQGHFHHLSMIAEVMKVVKWQRYLGALAPRKGTPHSSPQLKLGASCGGVGEEKGAGQCIDPPRVNQSSTYKPSFTCRTRGLLARRHGLARHGGDADLRLKLVDVRGGRGRVS